MRKYRMTIEGRKNKKYSFNSNQYHVIVSFNFIYSTKSTIKNLL